MKKFQLISRKVRILSTPLKMIMLMFLTAVMAACHVNSIEQDNPSIEDEKIVREVLNLPKSSVSLGYSTLNSRQKVLLWNIHTREYIAKNNFSKEVNEHILLLNKFVSTELYDNIESGSTKKQVADFEEKWFHEPIRSNKIKREILFEAGTIFGLGKAEQTKNGKLASPYSVQDEGTCTCYYSISCPGANQRCQDNGCAPKTGCGIAGSTNCDGVCNP